MLVIENFRSLRGQVAVPLDAQVVLIHGTNGMGKTSVLSALELALTGKVAHLAADGETYKRYLTTLGQASGSISLTTTAPLNANGRSSGTVEFSDTSFDASPLFDGLDARFFAERCYLPQATLGRLLEIYDDQKTSTTSPLTQFVKELLGLDPLDALVDGLRPAFHVTRIRNLVPEFRRLEALKSSLDGELSRANQSIGAAETRAATRRSEALSVLMRLGLDAKTPLETTAQIDALRQSLEGSQVEADALSALERTRAELKAASEAWRTLPASDGLRDQAAKDQASQAASVELEAWRLDAGRQLQAILDELRLIFPELPGLDDGPDTTRATAEARAEAESERCNNLLQRSAAAARRLTTLQQTIQRSTTRIGELDQALSATAESAQSLAGALAAIAPHVHGNNCPVCNRDFGEQAAGPLSAHIANNIAALTTEAGRLQALSGERAEQSNRLSVAQRDLISVEQEQVPAEEQADLTVRAARMAGFVQQLKALAPEATRGAVLMAKTAETREAASLVRRTHDLASSILPEIEKLVSETLNVTLSTFAEVDEALETAARALDAMIAQAQSRVLARVEAISALDMCVKELDDIERFQISKRDTLARLASADEAVATAATSRDISKTISDIAEGVRSAVVKKVFNTSLNRAWRDLFVRLAPSEDFVPIFKLPAGDKGKVEAVLETIHRSGKASGTPGAMLSQGNLNTAALTLFLALHLSVPARMPWLVLDDSVQSMDDVHVAQFAALLRSLSKGMNRQLVVAAHERALFDYLTLELSPAFSGDSLITVEVTRNFEGNTVATSHAFSFENDNVIAA
jgi:exonuclease SbcC